MQVENNRGLANSEEQEIDLMDLSRVLLRHWLWYAIALGIMLIFGVYYLLSTPKQYERSASVLIKDPTDQSSKSISNAMAQFSDFSGMGSSVDNEILIFKSNTLLTEVVERLNLNMSYKTRQGLRKVDLYGVNPFEVKMLDVPENQAVELDAKLHNDNKTIEVSKVLTWAAGDKVKLQGWSAQLGDTIATELGNVVIVPTNFKGNDNFKHNTITVRKNGVKNIVLGYAQSLQIALADKKATIINFSLKDESRQRAEDLINTLIDVYNEEAISDKNKEAMNTSSFINDRLIIIEQELSGVDTKIEQYKRSQKLTDITSEAGMYITETTYFNQQNLSLENQLNLAKYIKEYLTDPSNRGKLIPANTGVSDGNTERMIGEYNTTLMKRDRLLKNSSENNPVVMDLNAALFAMEQNIVRVMDNLIAGLNLQMNNIRDREQQTERRLEAVPSQQKYVLTVARQQKIKEELYLFLLNKREENALRQAVTQSNARIVDSARGSDTPVAPRSMIILAGCVMLGLILPTGVILLMTFMDTKVRSKEDLANLTVPLVGEIPSQITKKGEAEETVVVSETSRDAVSEAFRILRTNLTFMQRDVNKPLQVITFTSLSPNSGKTFISTNLGMGLAITGKRVVLVDLDIRKCQLSERMGLMNETGVTNYITGREQDVKNILYKSKYNDNLFIVPSGPTPPNPAELLLSGRLDDLINELRKDFDYILIDNVPAGVVADATIVDRLVDATICVMRAGILNKRDVQIIEEYYRSGKFKNMSAVLNGLKKSKRTKGYGYGYDYGYGYGNVKG